MNVEVASGTLDDFFRHQANAEMHQAAIKRSFSNETKRSTLQMLSAYDPTVMLVFDSRELWVRFGRLAIETQKTLVRSAYSSMGLTGTNKAEIHDLPWNPRGNMRISLKFLRISDKTLALSLGQAKLV
jgi:hypothetical protein